MRRIVVFNRITPEGFFADVGGSTDWFVPDEELDRAAVAASEQHGPGTILFGRRTYDMFESYWPHAVDDSATAADPHDPDRRSREIRAMAVWLNEAEKVVFSRTRGEVSWQNSRLLSELDPRDIEAMKHGPGKDMIIFGSGSIVSQLTQHRLIDEYQLILSPVLLGQGQPQLRDVTEPVRLNLLEATAFPSGNVRLRYAPAPARTAGERKPTSDGPGGRARPRAAASTPRRGW